MKRLIIVATCIAISYQINIPTFFQKLNDDTTRFNSFAAEISWELLIDPGNTELSSKAANFQRELIDWETKACGTLAELEWRQLLNNTQARMAYLMCSGPKFTFEEASKISDLYNELQSTYSDAEICIPYDKSISKDHLSGIEDAILKYVSTAKSLLKFGTNAVSNAAKLAAGEPRMESAVCLKGESDFEAMMKFSRNEEVLRWLWLVWREKVGPPMKESYRNMVAIENVAAERNGYKDIGAAWRDEMEMPNLRILCRQLYEQVKPLYSLLHGVVRFFLRKAYGDVVPERGLIPAHLLGNLWSQSWESIADLILLKTIDLDESLKRSNWTTVDIAKHADDFYLSLGLPAMTKTFWRESIFERKDENTRCHGTAADMYKDGDYRLLYCSQTPAEDLYVLHHEMGHIQYFMAYEKQPGIFRQANSALQETIGDTIMYGVLTPQHLYRLRLINDSILFNGDKATEVNDNDIFSAREDNSKSIEATADDVLLLKQALNKLPQIPFSLLIDEYRWKYFEGGMRKDSLNAEFWDLAMELQGIAPPELRGEKYFDLGAKYHVPDNTPFIRYFLSSFLQHQLFESLCKASVFGRLGVKENLPSSILMHRCDIYGSRSAGKILRNLMSKGHSQPWSEILQATIGTDVITASALDRYYRPLQKFLVRLVREHRIPIGW